eukprot:IDg1580t1
MLRVSRIWVASLELPVQQFFSEIARTHPPRRQPTNASLETQSELFVARELPRPNFWAFDPRIQPQMGPCSVRSVYSVRPPSLARDY